MPEPLPILFPRVPCYKSIYYKGAQSPILIIKAPSYCIFCSVYSAFKRQVCVGYRRGLEQYSAHDPITYAASDGKQAYSNPSASVSPFKTMN